jgi:hypothetical protein
MKKQTLFLVALCLIVSILSGCRHKVSAVISVQDTLTMASVYVDEGGTLRWEGADSATGKFQIKFLYDINPCDPKDVLNNGNTADVVCHVVQDSGTYIYEVLPYPGGPPASGTTNTQQNYAQVGGCTSCRTIEKGGPGGVTPTNRILIGCSDSKKVVVAGNPSSVAPGAVLQWGSLGADPPPSPKNGATFQKSPCTGGGVGPFYGPNFCTIAPTASGQYTYTAARAGCQENSDPMTFTVQP